MLYVTHIHNQEVSGTATCLLAHTHGSSIFDKVKYFDYLIKNRSTYSSISVWIHKCICSLTRDNFSRYMVIARIWIDILDNNLLGHTHRCFNHSPYLVDVSDVYFGYYDFKPTVRVYLWRSSNRSRKHHSQGCMVYCHSQWQIIIWVVHYILKLTFDEEVCIMIMSHQWVHLIEDHKIPSAEVLSGIDPCRSPLTFDYWWTPPGFLREPGSILDSSSCRQTSPGLLRESGSVHNSNRKEDSARTPTGAGLRPPTSTARKTPPGLLQEPGSVTNFNCW